MNVMNSFFSRHLFAGVVLSVVTFQSTADGIVVDKVYHPYVIANEREFEWRLLSSQTDTVNRLGQRLGYGFSLADNFALEGYVVGERDQTNDFDIAAYEFEARWMLTEQGQFWADYGVVFELERNTRDDSYEYSAGLIAEKEFTHTSLTLNLFLLYEKGKNIDSEYETEFRAKYRYRFLPEIQPALEVYAGEDFFGIGPAIMGVHRIEGQKQIKYEIGFITEIADSGKDHSLRLSIEYEF